jgi:enoyl-CoA hydratase/carnithine racemase
VLALVCDIVVVAEEAFMSMTEVDYGLAERRACFAVAQPIRRATDDLHGCA